MRATSPTVQLVVGDAREGERQPRDLLGVRDVCAHADGRLLRRLVEAAAGQA